MKIRKVTRDDVSIEVKCLEEFDDVRGNVLASGSKEADKEAEDEVLQQLEAGNKWAWCVAQVSAKWWGLRGTAELGHCSYKNEGQFRETSGYFESMIEEAIEDLNRKLQHHAELLRRLEIK